MDRNFKRIVLKLSGEALAGKQGYGIDPKTVDLIARDIATVTKQGIQVAIVVGGGNIWRGLSGSAEGMDRVSADYMGMLATVMNSLALQDALEKLGVATRLSICNRWRNLIFVVVLFVIWKKVALLSSEPARAILTSRRIQRQHCVPPKLKPMLS